MKERFGHRLGLIDRADDVVNERSRAGRAIARVRKCRGVVHGSPAVQYLLSIPRLPGAGAIAGLQNHSIECRKGHQQTVSRHPLTRASTPSPQDHPSRLGVPNSRSIDNRIVGVYAAVDDVHHRQRPRRGVPAYLFCFSTKAAKASIYCCSTFCIDSLTRWPLSSNASPTPFR
jgi:hypothetical protein